MRRRPRPPRPTIGRRPRRAGSLALLAAASVLVTACAGEPVSGAPGVEGPGATAPSGSPSAMTATGASPDPGASPAAELGPCEHVARIEERVDGLRAVELRLPNRVSLDIELGRVQAAFAELRVAELGDQEAQLEDPLRRLGYRLVDLEIAVEDFRTNPRVRRAAGHVETDSAAFADAVAGFAILAGC